MIRILVTGSNGLLGQTLLKQLLDTRCNVIAISKGENRFSIKKGYYYFAVDITNTNLLLQTIKTVKPHYIINTAVLSDLDFCEENQELCNAVNVESVKSLVSISKELNAHLIQISTDNVFDGKKEIYKETDKPNPINFFGKSKQLAEQFIIESNIDYTIIRTALVYGKVSKMNKSSLIVWLKETLEDQDKVNAENDQYKMPTYVESLARTCLLVMQGEAKGIYNVSSNELLSIYQIAQQVAEVFNLDTSLITPVSKNALNKKAKQPSKITFDLSKAINDLGIKPKSFKEDLNDFKKQLEKMDF